MESSRIPLFREVSDDRQAKDFALVVWSPCLASPTLLGVVSRRFEVWSIPILCMSRTSKAAPVLRGSVDEVVVGRCSTALCQGSPQHEVASKLQIVVPTVASSLT